MSYDPIIHTSKTTFMQRVQHHVSRGYIYYTQGIIEIKKLKQVVDKFGMLYNIDASRNQRAYAKKCNKANAHLLMYHSSQSTHVDFILLVTAGKGIVHDKEQLNTVEVNTRQNRLRFYDYELLRITKKEGERVWTWSIQKKCLEEWRHRIISAARFPSRKSLVETRRILRMLPMFSRIRDQVFALQKLLADERKRCFKKEEPLTFLRLPIITARKDHGVYLSELEVKEL